MISYEELYELLRKEKYGDKLQTLPPNFIKDLSDYLCSHKKRIARNGDFFSSEIMREKKEYENAFTLFRELMLRRKKKILDLVFVAAETGTMKRDSQDMLDVEKDLFDKMVLSVKDADTLIEGEINSCSLEDAFQDVLIMEDVEEFVDMSGKSVGPFRKEQVVKLDKEIAQVLVSGKKAVSV